jgi:hypothetical protein
MKTRPIFFNTEMIRAIMAGKKTQTRRICRHQHWSFSELTDFNINKETYRKHYPTNSPYGCVGDILYVRETTSQHNNKTIYRADVCSKYDLPDGCKWTPSIFMPRKDARLYLKITGVRVERLRDIKEEDCLAEGIRRSDHEGNQYYYFYPCKDLRDNTYLDSPITSFYSLWKSLYSQKSWDTNPYVFVYEFEVTEPTTETLRQAQRPETRNPKPETP